MLNLSQQFVFIEFLGPVEFYLGLGLKVIAAILLGIVIGLDREKKFKSAGIKTLVMISVGATIYTAISLLNMELYKIGDNVDPNRVTAQIVSGIGFLGAGAIIQSGGSIFGLTTAATIWVVAAIGIAIGSGYIFSATFFTITILIILNLIEPVMRFLSAEQIFMLEIQGKSKVPKDISRLLSDMDVSIIESEVFESNDGSNRCNFHLCLRTSNRDMKKLIHYIRAHSKVDTFTHRVVKKLSSES